MSMVTYIAASLRAAWRLANLDKSAAADFDVSAQGFWWSFIAALVGAPLFILLAVFERNLTETMASSIEGAVSIGFEGYYLNVALVYVLTWPLFGAAMIFVVKGLKVERSYVPVVVAMNWSRVVAMGVRLPAAALAASGALSAEFMVVALVLTFGLILYYQWFVLKSALESSGGEKKGNQAALILAADVLLAFLLSNAVSFIFGEPVQITTY